MVHTLLCEGRKKVNNVLEFLKLHLQRSQSLYGFFNNFSKLIFKQKVRSWHREKRKIN